MWCVRSEREPDSHVHHASPVNAWNYGYKEINLNLGCPSKKVQKNKFGACLMAEPDLVAKCIEAMAKSTSLPITIKTRIGYNEVENFEFLKSFIQRTKDAGSQKFIIHARKALLKKLSPSTFQV